ncbi:MAG TPA: aminopeptidase P family protein, partial [Myxococcaceae bacterium]|nr:aminopeptidase P family protein [Myxococcaceae bacterium]
PPLAPESEARASHDTAPPKALLDFMLQGWKAPDGKVPAPIKGHAVFAARRRALSALFPGETLLIPTGHEKVRANDTHYRFRPGTDFYYLTGNLEPDCVLCMDPLPEGGHRDVLFVEPNPGRSNATFYTDRKKGELWVGPRLGVEQSQARFAVDACRGLDTLKETLAAFGKAGEAGHRFRALRGVSSDVDVALPAQAERDRQFAAALSEMRLVKDAQEVRELGRSIAATRRGFEDVIRALKGAVSEREVEGVFNLRARVEGNDVGYNTIAASGPNACILHWNRNDGRIRPGTLLLLDAGVEGHTLYTADITRTLPVSGKLTAEQLEVYELVLAAQRAAFKVIKPGADFMEPNRAAMRILAQGLERLGILQTSADEALKEEHQFYKRYSLHNVSHMLGLDVHDCAAARAEAYKFGKLKAGMVFTVEPGLYFQTDDLTVPARYRGIGVRIEDDVVVTPKGYRNLSKGIPSAPKDVEKWMAALWRRAGTKSVTGARPPRTGPRKRQG